MPSPPKICLLTPAFPPWSWGGLAASAGRVADYAVGLGLAVHVVLARPGPEGSAPRLDQMRRDEKLASLRVHRLTLPGARRDPATRQPWDGPHDLTLRALGQALEMLHRQYGFALLHSFFLFPHGYVAGLTAARLGLPHLATVVGDDLNRFAHGPDKLAALQLALGGARGVVFLSEELRRLGAALATLPGPSPVILNSVDMPRRSWRPHRPGAPWRLGCAGKFKWSKGLPYLVEALRRRPPAGDWRLEVAGSLPAEEEAALAGLGERAVRRPPLPPAEVTRWLLSLDALVLPSLSEGCPNLLMEAMACGLPCVATRVGAVAELMADGVSGLLVPWGDPGALGQALARLRDDPAWARELGAQARRAMRAFSPARERGQWQALYRELLGT